MTARWRAEKDKLGAAQKIKEQLEAARNDLLIAQRKGDYAEAGRLTYGVLPNSSASWRRRKPNQAKCWWTKR